MGSLHGYSVYDALPREKHEHGNSDAAAAMATVGQDIFKPTKFGGKYTVTLIPGTRDSRPEPPSDSILNMRR